MAAALKAWFQDYLSTFAAFGRGDRDDLDALLEFYAVPLLLTTDDAVLAITTERDVVSAMRRQIDALRDAQYDHSELLSSELTLINERTALYDAAFSRRRSDGTEIGRLAAAYLVIEGQPGRRIAALMVRSH